jgi:hypothetical protein
LPRRRLEEMLYVEKVHWDMLLRGIHGEVKEKNLSCNCNNNDLH